MKKSVFSMILMLALVISALSLNAYAAEMADGTYEVNIALWHSEDDKASMAADAVGTKATIEVANGVKTMHITSGEMSMMGMKASLQELRIADKNGNFTDAKVESKNSEGDPTGFYFVMPHTDEYITVKVNPHLAIMGNKDIGARIKVDYSTLKLVKAAESTSAGELEATVVQTVDENGETVESLVTVAAEENQTEAETDGAAQTTAQTVQTTGGETQSADTQAEEVGNTEIYVAAAVIAAVIVLIIIKKKLKK